MTRTTLKNRFTDFLNIWTNDNEAAPFLSENVQLHNFSGSFLGKEDVLTQLQNERSEKPLNVQYTNLYIAGKHDKAAVSAYIYGKLGEHSFHGVLLLKLSKQQDWQIDEIRSTHALNGNALAKHWLNGKQVRRDWQPADPTRPIVSELDSPWHLFPDNEFHAETAEAQIAELYAKYAWGLDFADFALLASVFDDNITSDLTPMGKRQTLRETFGQLRAFRLAAGELFHATEVLEITQIDEKHAAAKLGRVIPEQTHTENGEKLFGAYYDVEVVRDANGNFKYQKFDYYPQWFVLHKEK